MSNEGRNPKKKSIFKTFRQIKLAITCAIVAGIVWVASQLGLDFSGFGINMGSGGQGGSGNGGGYGYHQEYQGYPSAENGGEYQQGQGYGEGSAGGEQEYATEYAEEERSLVIVISGEQIMHGNREITLQELSGIVLEINTPDDTWELWDNQAIKATYDQAKAVLIDNAIRFEERTSGA